MTRVAPSSGCAKSRPVPSREAPAGQARTAQDNRGGPLRVGVTPAGPGPAHANGTAGLREPAAPVGVSPVPAYNVPGSVSGLRAWVSCDDKVMRNAAGLGGVAITDAQ